MNVLLWALQILLAATFLISGIMKTTQPKEKLAPMMPYVEDFSSNTVKLIGLAELLAAVGLILPPLLDILPWLAALAASGLAVLMAGAFMTHRRRSEQQGMMVTAVLGVLALIVAVGRFGPESF
jgi:uncharacterized membrane protein